MAGSTGEQRLREKHANKRQNVVKLSDDLLRAFEPDAHKTRDRAEIKARISDFNKLDNMSELEQQYFDLLCAKLEAAYGDDAFKLHLAARNLAKLYAYGKRLEAEMEGDSLIMQDKDGKVYVHPGLRILQANQKCIMSNLSMLGIHSDKISKKENNTVSESEFAQFQ